jgi:hypothetical protein
VMRRAVSSPDAPITYEVRSRTGTT